jgi:hypothetical protein
LTWIFLPFAAMADEWMVTRTHDVVLSMYAQGNSLQEVFPLHIT